MGVKNEFRGKSIQKALLNQDSCEDMEMHCIAPVTNSLLDLAQKGFQHAFVLEDLF